MKTKLAIIFLMIIAGFIYQYVTTINDTDVEKVAQQLVEQKLSSKQKLIFNNVKVMKRNQYNEGEGVRVCGTYQVDGTSKVIPFVASIDVRDGEFSGHNQLLLSNTPEIEASITNICKEDKQ
ncbi:hypothetical protein [Providencia burhodogranariea]|uniref:Uncharacterized protein n=1 Tax=Providencia burhodogranariea DSM 19968 TaxID=1141662 RepID=K8WUE7_9GAMM|nr:hypothetical protein [Providencia burhodogranariea]EKT63546.1 hypothetical protein OOA_04197 [Providencia burhodogranariea DSM 19968]